MTKHAFSLFLVCLVAIGFACPVARGDALHDQISILSDTDLHLGNGVMSGSGSMDDPYIISDWSIEVQAGIGIEVKGISVHLIIRDCEIAGNGRTSIGILLSNVSHVQVTNCRLTGLASGIFVYQSPTMIMDHNAISSCRRGIEGTESDGTTITGNVIVGAKEHGIFLWRCHDASLIDNRVTDCRNGIYLDSCHYDNLEGNHAENLDHGIFLWDCFDCTVVANVLQYCQLGLAIVHTSERNRIFRNSFIDNTRAATCDEMGNSWDSGYLTGGNFWGGNFAADLFSGENQDRPDSDGISDSPREIPFGNVDRYPLMEQPAVENET